MCAKATTNGSKKKKQKKKPKKKNSTREDKRKRAKLPSALSSLVFLVVTGILKDVLFFFLK